MGDKRGGGADMLRPIEFNDAGVYISARLPFEYLHVW